MMGLDFWGSEAHWSYSGFNRFRTKIADEIGIDLNDMEGYRSGGLKWNSIKDDIKYLLNHSDCDGQITPKRCAKVAVRLRRLVNNWEDDDYDKEQALLLADSMEECAKNNKPLIFC